MNVYLLKLLMKGIYVPGSGNVTGKMVQGTEDPTQQQCVSNCSPSKSHVKSQKEN